MLNSFAAFIYAAASFMLGRLLNIEKWYDRGYQDGYEKAIKDIEMEVLHG